MYEIAEFDNAIPGNNAVNVKKGRNIKYDTFKELAERFNNCIAGNKHDRYFSRGRLAGPNMEFHRRDDYLRISNLFIIDGDSTRQSDGSGTKGAPAISLVRSVLKSLKLSYCLYTSHSHTSESNRYRIIIPLTEGITKEELKIIAPNIIGYFNDEGLPIGWGAGEHDRWSQAWYEPTRTDPDDGLFQWHYSGGEALDPTRFMEVSETTSADIIPSISLSWKEHMEHMQSGDFHEHMRPLIWGMIKDGTDKAVVKATVESLMSSIPDSLKDDRWTNRYDSIDNSIKGAIKKQDAEEPVDDHGITYEAPTKETLPWPPGMLGEIMTLSMDQQTYPHEEIALASALGLVAGIAGRKFNVDSMDGLGLNIYIMLAAPSGTGKSGISNFITKNIPASNGAIKSSFVGPSNFTGATGIIKNHLKDARCMVMAMSEMAQVLDSKSGDQAGKRRFLLDAYGQSGHNDVLSGTVFSSTDNSVPDLNSPSFSLVGESTPEKLLRILRRDESLSDGWLPRFSVFRINDINEVPNRNYIKQENVPIHIKERVLELVALCESIQSQPTFECHMLTMDQDVMFDHMIKWRQIYKEHNGINELKSVMATRMHIKALKYAGLATVINKSKNEANCLVIEKREWDWAIKMLEYEWNGIDSFFQGTFSGSPLDDAATDIIGKYILLALDKRLARDTTCPAKLYNAMNPLMRDAKAVSVSGLRQCCGPMLNDIGNNFKDGFDVAIEYMIAQGYVKRDKTWKPMLGKRKCDVILITQNFYDRLESKL